jgi:proline iminopeptidase
MPPRTPPLAALALALAAALSASACARTQRAPAPPPQAAPAARAEAAPGATPPGSDDWFPVPPPIREGDLPVSELHTLHYVLSGNPRGRPVMVLHGGPGGGTSPSLRRYFDPAEWLVVEHDQRGSGKSTPYAELRENTTAALVADVERLREHLGLERVTILGGSWGSTLALAYAERHPTRVAALVLRGVFTCTRAEIDHFYHGGVEPFFPEAYAALRAAIPRPETRDWPRQLALLTTSSDAAARDRAVAAWALYETRISRVGMTDAAAAEALEGYDALGFSRIENHYMANACFLEEGELLRNLGVLAEIPTVIVQGRYDVITPPVTAWRVHRALPRSRLVLVEDGGHSGGSPPIRRGLTDAVRSLEPVVPLPAGAFDPSRLRGPRTPFPRAPKDPG